jgi:hypothetical protein
MADLTVRKDDPTVPDAVEPDAPTPAERPQPSAETEQPEPSTEAARLEPAANAERLEPAIEAERQEPAAEAVRPESSTKEFDGLLPAGDIDQYRTDWRAVQSGFVDDPAGAVHKADALLGRLADAIVDRIAKQRAALADARVDETPDDKSDEASGDDGQTERLRLALQEYRTLFQQLLPAGRS